jgi:hypothetical protein
MKPILIVDDREYEIRASTWADWKRFAEPFESPDDVLARLFKAADGRDRRSGSASGPSLAGTTGGQARKGRSKHRTGRTRVASHLLLPEAEYEQPILQALHEAGGRAPAREVIEAVGSFLGERLTETDKEMMHDGRAARWQNRTQFARLRLVKQGFLKNDSPRGVWEIAPAGADRLRQAT